MIRHFIKKDEFIVHLELAKSNLGDNVTLLNEVIRTTGFSRNTIITFLKKYDLMDSYVIYKPFYDRNKRRKELDESIKYNGVTSTCQNLTPLEFQYYKKYYPDKKIKRIAWAVFNKFITMTDEFIEYVDSLNKEILPPKVNMSILYNNQDNSIIKLAQDFINNGKYAVKLQRDINVYAYTIADMYELYRYDKEQYKIYKLKYLEDTYYKYVKTRNIQNLAINRRARAKRRQETINSNLT